MKVVCFGDSNTYGYDPRSYLGDRYPKESRWVDLLAEQTGWCILNKGMNGREIPREKQPFPDHTDLLILMLGTNDLLQGNSADMTAARMKAFLQTMEQPPHQILLVSPPALKSGEWVQNAKLIRESEKLGPLYQEIAAQAEILFADAALWNIPLCFDGVHFTEYGHELFAEKLSEIILQISQP